MKPTLRILSLFAATLTACSLISPAGAASIGVHFVRGAGSDVTGVQDGTAISLQPTDSAGAGAFAQVNWNNLGARGTNINVMDSTGAASSVVFNWDSANVWSQAGGGTPTTQGSPDGNLMNGYLDSNNTANTAVNPNLWANGNGNKPLVHVSGLSAWLATQGATYYDVVIYSDGDATSGRTGEFWTSDVNTDPAAMVVGNDQIRHVFICDRANYVSTVTYAEVPLLIQSGFTAQLGNFPGNYAVLDSLTADSFLLQTAEFNTRAVINAIQIIPRTTPLPPTVSAQVPSQVIAGSNVVLRATVAGRAPQTYRWQKNGVDLADGGNVTGSTTTTLTLANVGSGDAATYSLVVTNPIGTYTNSITTLTIASPVAGSYVEKVITNGPYAYWRFNETADPTTGYVSAGDHAGRFSGTYGSVLQNGYTGVAGPQPPEFPGMDSGNFALLSTYNVRQSWVLAPPLNLNTNTVTFCTWIYPYSGQAGFTALLQARNGNDTGAFGYGNNNNLGYTWNSNSAATYNYVSGLVPPSNQWSFVALAISPTNAIFYLYNTNGQTSATNTLAHTNQAMTGPTLIGTDNGTLNRTFNGVIDEFAVFNRTLPPAEIFNLYKKGLGLDAIPPVIPTQPKSLALLEGRNAKFTITASGDEPFTYQWRRNGNNLANGGNVSGANTPALSLNNVSLAGNAGDYDIVVGNLAGSITSSVAALIVVASNSAPTAYEAELREKNPIAYWRLGETNLSPNSFDYWGGNIATNEFVTLEVPGPVSPDFVGLESTNTGGQYDGLSTSTATTESLMNNRAQFSIIGWFNTAGPIGERVGLFGQNDVCEFGFHGLGPDGLAQIGFWTPRGAAYLNQSNIMAGVWYMVAAVGSGTNVSLTLVSTNGGGGFQVLQANSAHTATTNYGSSSYSFKIGGGGILDATGNFFTGLIDEVAVYDRALSVGELSDLFGAALTGGELPPGISSVTGSMTLYAGRTATFHVSAVGSSLLFNWRSNGIPLTDGGNLWGSLTDTLTITNVSTANAASYDVVVSNSGGSVTSTPPATLTVVTPAPGGYEATVLAANPHAYYRLNSTNDPSTGTEVNLDLWGGHNGFYGAAAQNGFNGILGPQPPFFTFETNNPALATLPATLNSYATAPIGSLSTNNVTFTMWIQPAGAVDDYSGLLVNRNAGVAGGFGFGIGGQLGYTWNNNNANTYGFASGLIPPTGQWSFVALVVEPTQATLYQYSPDGLLSATNVVAHSADVFGNNWQIGHDNQDSSATRTFNGLIDEVAVFNYSLTPAQLLSLYAAGAPVPVSLTITQSGANVTVTWPQGTLLEADEATGPWSTNTAASPYVTTPAAAKKFYRVIVK